MIPEEDKWLRSDDGSMIMQPENMNQSQKMPELESDLAMQIHTTRLSIQKQVNEEYNATSIDPRRKRLSQESTPMVIDNGGTTGLQKNIKEAGSDVRAREAK